MIKGLPDKIYLQISDEETEIFKEDINWEEIQGATWCDQRIHRSDIEFLLAPIHMAEHEIAISEDTKN